jgi:hypothetical protein
MSDLMESDTTQTVATTKSVVTTQPTADTPPEQRLFEYFRKEYYQDEKYFHSYLEIAELDNLTSPSWQFLQGEELRIVKCAAYFDYIMKNCRPEFDQMYSIGRKSSMTFLDIFKEIFEKEPDRITQLLPANIYYQIATQSNPDELVLGYFEYVRKYRWTELCKLYVEYI